MLMKTGTILVLFSVAFACTENGPRDFLYVYPDGRIADVPPPDVSAGPDIIIDPPDDLTSSDRGKPPEDILNSPDLTDLLPDPGGPDLYDISVDMDLGPLDWLNEIQLPKPDLPPVEDSYTFPEVTNDCDPLGLPTKWKGTFDGEIKSNIPDMLGYTFNGGTEGAISFEIKCVNQKYLVVGELDGGSTNCALPTGCPFLAKMGGIYNPQTQHMHGTLSDFSIDYSAVIVSAEGEFDGDLLAGPELSGTWVG